MEIEKKNSDYGEVINYEDTVVVVHNAGTDDVDVKYISSDGIVVIRYNDKEFEYSTGCIEKLEAKVNNGVVTVTGRRCYNGMEGEDTKDIQEGS